MLLAPSEPAGERPREGGEVVSLFASNIARKLRTPLLDRSPMTDSIHELAITSIVNVKKCNKHDCGTVVAQDILAELPITQTLEQFSATRGLC